MSVTPIQKSPVTPFPGFSLRVGDAQGHTLPSHDWHDCSSANTGSLATETREDLRGQNLSFTEIAKLVGEKWQVLSPEEKDPYDSQASAAKERYNAELTVYKKMDGHRAYTQYLADFKAKYSIQQSGTVPVLPLRPSSLPA